MKSYICYEVNKSYPSALYISHFEHNIHYLMSILESLPVPRFTFRHLVYVEKYQPSYLLFKVPETYHTYCLQLETLEGCCYSLYSVANMFSLLHHQRSDFTLLFRLSTKICNKIVQKFEFLIHQF